MFAIQVPQYMESLGAWDVRMVSRTGKFCMYLLVGGWATAAISAHACANNRAADKIR